MWYTNIHRFLQACCWYNCYLHSVSCFLILEKGDSSVYVGSNTLIMIKSNISRYIFRFIKFTNIHSNIFFFFCSHHWCFLVYVRTCVWWWSLWATLPSAISQLTHIPSFLFHLLLHLQIIIILRSTAGILITQVCV